MRQTTRPVCRPSRREFMAIAAGTALAAAGGIPEAKAQAPAVARSASSSRPNIVFIFTDQERYQRKWRAGPSLRGHERLARSGTTFQNHYCPAAMCTASRSVLLPGSQTTAPGMYDNTACPWAGDMSTKTPTIGQMSRNTGYSTAYKG